MVDLLWGKYSGLASAPYSLAAHLLDTAAAATALAPILCSARWLEASTEALGYSDVDQTVRLIATVAGLHDIGKATPCFQFCVPEMKARYAAGDYDMEVAGFQRHDLSGSVLSYEHLVAAGLAQKTEASFFGAIIGAHHGTFIDKPARKQRRRILRDVSGGQTFERNRKELFESIPELLNTVWPGSSRKSTAPVAAGLVSLSDWIVSDTEWINRRDDQQAQQDPAGFYRSGVEQLRERFNELGLRTGPIRPRTFSELFPGFSPRGVQKLIPRLRELVEGRSDSGGIAIIAAPTGDGKTEAGLTAASALAGNETMGLLYALPTQATTDAMFDRVSDFVRHLKPDSLSDQQMPVTLNHGMAGLNASYDNSSLSFESDGSGFDTTAQRWLKGRHKGLLAPVAIATVDQLLLMGLAVKYGTLRHVAVVNKVVVVDEAHSYDPYMRALLTRVLNWLGHYRVPVVLLSATLPQRFAEEYIRAYQSGVTVDDHTEFERAVTPMPYPGIASWVPGIGEVSVWGADSSGREVDLSINKASFRFDDVGDDHLVVTRALSDLDEGGCVAVICNTVGEAQRLFDALRLSLPDEVDITLLHSRLPLNDRTKRTNELLVKYGKAGNRPERGVVVATQIIEQSLDLDFDHIISYLAPIAQLLQRAGRCHRHPGRKRPAAYTSPALTVLIPDLSTMPRSWTFVYYAAELLKTAEVVADLTTIAIPCDVQKLVDAVDVFELEVGSAEQLDQVLQHAEMDRFASESQDKEAANVVAIPHPEYIDGFSGLSSVHPDHDALATTRLGIDSTLVLLCREVDGELFGYDGRALPVDPSTNDDVKKIVGCCVPVRSSWLKGYPSSLPPAWADSAWLEEIVVLRTNADSLRFEGDSTALTLDSELGLQKESL